MGTKSILWQSRWDIDPQTGVATHETGLLVRLVNDVGIADNADAVASLLQAAHGAHNAAAMVRRLTREGEQLLIDPSARGWRGKDRRPEA